MDNLIGNSIIIPWPEWRLVEKIGRGQFGTVYKISSTKYGATEYAAMKVISIPTDPQQIQMDYSYGYDTDSVKEKYKSYLEVVLKEYQLMMKVKGSRGVVRCDDIILEPHDDGIGYDIFIRMEYLMPMLQCITDLNNEESIIKLGMDICNALDACEKANILHRDIKPSNILVNNDGDFKLGDFGVSRILETENTYGTQGIGTYDYMAPEIYRGEKYGKEADIYSLGLVLYWLLNNRTFPFLSRGKAPTTKEISSARQRRFSGEELPAPTNGSRLLKSVVLKACAFNPNERYKTANELLRDLINCSSNTISVDNTSSTINGETIVFYNQQDNLANWNDSQETVGRNYSAGNNTSYEAETIGKRNEKSNSDEFSIRSNSNKKSTGFVFSSQDDGFPKNSRPQGVSDHSFSQSYASYQLNKKEVLKNAFGITEGYVEIKNDNLLIYKKTTYVIPLVVVTSIGTRPVLKLTIKRDQIKNMRKDFAFKKEWLIFELSDGNTIAINAFEEQLILIEDWYNNVNNSSMICSYCNNWISSRAVVCPYCNTGIISINRVVKPKLGREEVVFYGYAYATGSVTVSKMGFISKTIYNGKCNFETNKGSLYIFYTNENNSNDESVMISKKDIQLIEFSRMNVISLRVSLIDKTDIYIKAPRKTLIYLYAFLDPN